MREWGGVGGWWWWWGGLGLSKEKRKGKKRAPRHKRKWEGYLATGIPPQTESGWKRGESSKIKHITQPTQGSLPIESEFKGVREFAGSPGNERCKIYASVSTMWLAGSFYSTHLYFHFAKKKGIFLDKLQTPRVSLSI